MSDKLIGLRVGDPEQWRDFDRRHPVFREAWPRLKEALEQAFLRKIESAEAAPRLIFGLGRIAIEEATPSSRRLATRASWRKYTMLLPVIAVRVWEGATVTCR